MMKKWMCMLLATMLCMAAAMAAANGATPALQGAGSREEAVELTLGEKTLGEMVADDDATQEQWFKSVSTDAGVFYSLTLENLGNSGSAEGIPFGLYDADGEDLYWDYCKTGEEITVSAKYPVGNTIYARVWGTRFKCIDGRYRMVLKAVPDAEADDADAAGEIESGKVYSMDAGIDQDVFVHRTGETAEYMTIRLSNISVEGDLYFAIHDPDGMKLAEKRTYDPSSQNETIVRMEPGCRYVITVFTGRGTGNYKLDVAYTQDLYGETRETAAPIAPQADIVSRIDGPDDVDCFAFDAKAAGEVHTFTYTNMGVAGRMPIKVYDQYGQLLAESKTPREMGTATLEFAAEMPDTYYLQLDKADSSSDNYGPYHLQYAVMSGEQMDDAQQALCPACGQPLPAAP